MGKAKKAAAAAADVTAKAAVAAGGIGVSTGDVPVPSPDPLPAGPAAAAVPPQDLLGMFATAPAAAAPAAAGAAPDLLSMGMALSTAPAAVTNLLGMTTTSPPPPVAANLLSMVPALDAPAVCSPTAGSSGVSASGVKSGWLQKQTGVRKIWRPWYAKLGDGVLSWFKYETDLQARDELDLDKRWLAEACNVGDMDADTLLSCTSTHDCADHVFVLKLSTDVRVCHYFTAKTLDERDSWVAALSAEVEKSDAVSLQTASTAAAAGGDESASDLAAGKKKAGKFLKGIKSKAVQAANDAAKLGAGAISASAREFGEADNDDYDVLLPIGCRARSGLLQKEATGVMHKWEERWFELTKTGKLFYYKDQVRSYMLRHYCLAPPTASYSQTNSGRDTHADFFSPLPRVAEHCQYFIDGWVGAVGGGAGGRASRQGAGYDSARGDLASGADLARRPRALPQVVAAWRQ